LAAMLAPFVALRGGRVTAYVSATGFRPLNHAAAEREEDMKALLAGAAAATGAPLSLLLPTRQAGLFRRCLNRGLRRQADDADGGGRVP
jgi:hypothetical protein